VLSAQVERCGTHWRRATSSNWAAQKEAIDQAVEQWLEQHSSSVELRSTITIPVVVHVVWHREEENISDAQVLSQLDIINDDFNAQNEQLDFLPAEFRDVLGDVGIEFCLSDVDDRGRAATGITRTYTNERSIASNQAIIKDATFGGVDAWDTRRFLNIWVGRRDDRILGDATSPGEVEEELDGVVIDFRAFGDQGTVVGNEPYHLGRTLTHELGHYFGLRHIWGEGAGNDLCIFDDGISDTPVQESTYFGECPNTPQRTCGTSDMYMNFLNYTEDACMSMFTVQQKVRMLAVLNTLRKGLLEQGRNCRMTSTTETAVEINISIYPTPATEFIQLEMPHLMDEITLHNSLGQRVWQTQQQQQTTLKIDVRSLPSGIYYLHFLLSDQYWTRKVIVQ
jgi:hypothetical protein